MSADELWRKITELHSKGVLKELAGLGRYDTFCHVDVDPKAPGRLRQWDERKKK
jgi:hypothetical protein